MSAQWEAATANPEQLPIRPRPHRGLLSRLGLAKLFPHSGHESSKPPTVKTLTALGKELDRLFETGLSQGEAKKVNLVIPSGGEGETMLRNAAIAFDDSFIGSREHLSRLAAKPTLRLLNREISPGVRITEEFTYNEAVLQMLRRQQQDHNEPLAYNMVGEQQDEQTLVVPSQGRPGLVYTFPMNGGFSAATPFEMTVVLLPDVLPKL